MVDKPKSAPTNLQSMLTVSYPPYFLPLCALTAASLLVGPNFLLGLLSLIVLVFIAGLTWKQDQVPVLFFFVTYQWLEASIAIIQANISGTPISETSNFPAAIGSASAMVLISLLAMSIGFRVTTKNIMHDIGLLKRSQLLSMSVKKWFWIYAAAFVAAIFLQVLAQTISPLRQPLLALSNFRWAFFLIFTMAVFVRGSGNRALWLSVFIFEFTYSLGGYFSSFKWVFIFAFIGILGAGAKLRGRALVATSLIFSIALLAGITWTAIKVDYRIFVNGGSQSQSVHVAKSEQLGKMFSLISSLRGVDIAIAIENLSNRITYVQYFGAAIEYVPSNTSHTYGSIWADGLTRPFMPRVFFPQKAIIDESNHTNKYTGLSVAGMDRGTQISIGYFGDAYIDFGKFGMVLTFFLFGVLIGKIYSALLHARQTRGVFGMGLSGAILIPIAHIGMSAPKLLGALAAALIAVWIFNRAIAPYLWRYSKLPRTLSDCSGALC